MRHPLMIMMTMASALSQCVIRTVSGCTMTFKTRCNCSAVTSVTVASGRMPTVDRRKPRRFERRFRLGGLQKRHKRFDVRLRITGLRDDILDWRLVQRRQSYRELEARGRIGRIDDAQSRLVGRKEIDHAGGAFGDGNGPIALVDRDANLAQQLDRTGTGRVAVGVG